MYEFFLNSSVNLSKIKIFHTDRGNEFKNKVIVDVTNTFKIQRYLNKKGCPYDNAVAEATYKVVKTRFAYERIFRNLSELKIELKKYAL